MEKLDYKLIESNGWSDYELIDSGNKRKLERFGQYILDRFEPDATWKPVKDKNLWNLAFNQFILNTSRQNGFWKYKNKTQKEWKITLDDLTIVLKLSNSRHIGIFPEQLENWRWLHSIVRHAMKPVRILNLFAYTGVASLYCLNAGGEVTHVDASRTAIEMAKKSQSLSGLAQKPIRWIIDDVTKFVKREIRRGNVYEGIILDPPLFGRGPKGEIWKFEESLEEMLGLLNQLFSENDPFFLLTAYNISYSEKNLAQKIANNFTTFNGKIQFGPLIQVEKSTERKLKQAIYIRGAHKKLNII